MDWIKFQLIWMKYKFRQAWDIEDCLLYIQMQWTRVNSGLANSEGLYEELYWTETIFEKRFFIRSFETQRDRRDPIILMLCKVAAYARNYGYFFDPFSLRRE